MKANTDPSRRMPARCIMLVIFCCTMIIPQVAFAAPPRCTDFAVENAQGTRIVLRWTAPTPVSPETLTELDIRMSNVPISTLNFNSRTRCDLLTEPGVPGALQSATIADLTVNTTYYFAIKNRSASGWSTMSNLVMAVTGGSTASATLAWDLNAEPDVAGYKLYYGTESGSYTLTMDVGNVSEKEIPDLVYGNTYYFAVIAYNAEKLESPFSNEVSFSP